MRTAAANDVAFILGNLYALVRFCNRLVFSTSNDIRRLHEII